jgi:hypothetical protein
MHPMWTAPKDLRAVKKSGVDKPNRQSVCGRIQSTPASYLEEFDGGRSCGQRTVAHSLLSQAEEGTPGDCDPPFPLLQTRPRGGGVCTEPRHLGASGE